MTGPDEETGLRAPRFWSGVVLHLGRPFQKTPQVVALPPHELGELQEADFMHLDPGVRFDSPQQVGTAPGRQVVPAGGIPEKSQHVAHVPTP